MRRTRTVAGGSGSVPAPLCTSTSTPPERSPQPSRNRGQNQNSRSASPRGPARSSHGASSSPSSTACRQRCGRSAARCRRGSRTPSSAPSSWPILAWALERPKGRRPRVCTDRPSRPRRENPLRGGRRCRRSAGGPGRAGPAGHRSGDATGSRCDGGGLQEDRRAAAECGWKDRCRTGKQATKAPGGLVILVVNPYTRGFLNVRCWDRPTSRQVGNSSV